MWFSVVCTLIDNDMRHHSGQNVVDSRGPQQIKLDHKARALLYLLSTSAAYSHGCALLQLCYNSISLVFGAFHSICSSHMVVGALGLTLSSNILGLQYVVVAPCAWRMFIALLAWSWQLNYSNSAVYRPPPNNQTSLIMKYTVMYIFLINKAEFLLFTYQLLHRVAEECRTLQQPKTSIIV